MRQSILVQAFCFLAILISGGCGNCRYEIEFDHISNQCGIEQGFVVQELSIHTFDKQGLPAEREVTRSALLAVKDGADVPREVFFHRASTDYSWIEPAAGTSTDVLPFDFEEGHWYLLRGLMHWGNPDQAAFVQVLSGHRLQVYGFSEAKNW